MGRHLCWQSFFYNQCWCVKKRNVVLWSMLWFSCQISFYLLWMWVYLTTVWISLLKKSSRNPFRQILYVTMQNIWILFQYKSLYLLYSQAGSEQLDSTVCSTECVSKHDMFWFRQPGTSSSDVSVQECVSTERAAGTTRQAKQAITIKQISFCGGRCMLSPTPLGVSHLFLLQHVCLAQDLHGVHVTRVFLLHQSHLRRRL